MIKTLIILLLIAIVASLATGFVALMNDNQDSRRMVNALTVRVILSVLLVVLLFVAWYTGNLQPHGIQP